MNEGISRALRRQARAEGHPTGNYPGRETKALWKSLSHRERGQWRAKLPASRALRKRRP